MATKQSEQQLSSLVINKVDSLDTFNEMIEGELVNDDELYLVEGADDELGLSVVGGVLCATYDGEESGDISHDSYSGYSGNVARAYSSSNTYVAGEYCMQDYTLYKCTTAISAPEAWNAEHWTAVYLMDEVGAVLTAVSATGVSF